ncbi:hypothetical protein [Streptomyces sp. NBC_01198]|uniref:hypothetical protein n=1 Tax=Streptomyces sp. NBC_01198 TaxID=2903769 RepID=UPI002E0E2D80|nr:hypothetical protein OG702_19560 [Streptomyces sp. NBC_01198]
MSSTRPIPAVLLKVLVTACLGALSYLLTNLADQPEIWKITVSVFIAGAALIVQYLADFEGQLSAHALEVKTLVRDGLTGFNDATRLSALLEESPIGSAEVEQLSRTVVEFGAGRPDLLYVFARSEIARLAGLLADLRGNHADYEGEDRDWLLSLTRCAAVSVDAASTSVDREFWDTDLGRHYESAQEAAVRRGVPVRRLIIVNTPAEIDTAVTEVRDRQKSLGIDVRVLAVSTLSAAERRDSVKNFVLFDGAVGYESSTEDSDPSRIYETSLAIGDRVTERVRRFQVLWAKGE